MIFNGYLINFLVNLRNYLRRASHASQKKSSISYASWEKGKIIQFNNIQAILFLNHAHAFDRSYGSVYKALHKESGQVLAIKQVIIIN